MKTIPLMLMAAASLSAQYFPNASARADQSIRNQRAAEEHRIMKDRFINWPNGVVPYIFHKSIPERCKESIRDVAERMNQAFKIRIRHNGWPLTIRNENIRLESDETYHYIFPINIRPMRKGDRHHVEFRRAPSYFKGTAAAPMQFEFTRLRTVAIFKIFEDGRCGAIGHELIHVLGMGHEHERVIRDDYIQFVKGGFGRMQEPMALYKDHPYNYASISTYGKEMGDTVMDSKPGGIPFTCVCRDDEFISPGDMDRIWRMYIQGFRKGLRIKYDDGGQLSFLPQIVISANPLDTAPTVLAVDGRVRPILFPKQFMWKNGETHTIEVPMETCSLGRVWRFSRWSDKSPDAFDTKRTIKANRKKLTWYEANYARTGESCTMPPPAPVVTENRTKLVLNSGVPTSVIAPPGPVIVKAEPPPPPPAPESPAVADWETCARSSKSLWRKSEYNAVAVETRKCAAYGNPGGFAWRWKASVEATEHPLEEGIDYGSDRGAMDTGLAYAKGLLGKEGIALVIYLPE